jgi:hypothetical protein
MRFGGWGEGLAPIAVYGEVYLPPCQKGEEGEKKKKGRNEEKPTNDEKRISTLISALFIHRKLY